jgi:hypothetical protein
MERDGRGGWSDPRELPTGAPPVSSDACVGVDGGGLMHLAFAASEGPSATWTRARAVSVCARGGRGGAALRS